MSLDDNIWYAVNQTRVITEPKQTIETFGVTRIRYYIVSEVLDSIGQVKVHEGIITSEKPSIITPQHFAQQILNGFGEEAKAYADWLSQHGDFIKIVQYGLQIKKEEIKEETVSGTLDEVIGRVIGIAENSREVSTVIQGVENMWEISLMKFMENYIASSVSKNFQEMQSHQQVLMEQEETNVRQAIEEEFYESRGHRQKIVDLGSKLQDMGLFAKYEDRFYALLRECS